MALQRAAPVAAERARDRGVRVGLISLLLASPYGKGATAVGFRYLLVSDCFAPARAAGVPVNTTRPPLLPPSGPRSTTQSARRTTSMLCSMTMTVLPAST